MKIKLKTRAAGPEGVWGIGAVLDLPEAQAKQLVDGGYADALEQPEPITEPIKKPKTARK